MRKSFFWWALLTAAGISIHGAEQVTITEFMASNTSTLQDENGLYPDWIEIYNSGTNAVNLFNWSLTDNAGNLTKWRFPATNINAGAFMVIFADGKDRKTPGAPLHTSFNLEAGGEYLALVKPDGVTKATEFAAELPQTPDVSFGFGTLTSNFTVIATSAPVRVQIPESDADGTNWLYLGFDDSSWIAGTNGVGYGATNAVVADYGAAVAPTLPVLYYRLNESSGTVAANLGSGGAAMNGTYTSATMGTAGPRPPAWNGFEANNNAPTFNGTSSFVGGPSQLLSGRSAFTMAGWINSAGAQLPRTGLFGQNDVIEFGFSAAGNLQCFTSGGGTLNVTYTPPLNTWVHILVVGDGSNLRIFINGVLSGTGGSATANYGSAAFNFNIGGGGIFDSSTNYFNGQIDEVSVWHRALTTTEIASLYSAGTNAVGVTAASFVRTDVGTAMSNVNASAYIRIPFNVSNPTNVTSLTLRMRHDDGFIAYINGTELLRANAPITPLYNSTATTNHSPAVVDSFLFNPTLLQPGTNILAIQGLNVAANNEDFLIVAELIASTTTDLSPTPVYFAPATPGAANSAGVINPGPAILVPGHTPNVPLDAQDLVVTAKVVQTFFPVGSMVMRYKIMFGPEVEVAMFDDGFHGDGATNDGVFGATIPASASTNGQMIRWYFRATDTQGNISRWPLFANPSESAEFLGTIVNPTNVTSKLPIYHIFAAPGVLGSSIPTAQTGADSQGGGRVAIFYDGEFYDNVEMNLRGNSTSGFNKKAHHLNFNRDHRFRHSGPGGRIRHTSFTAEYPDPSYMRQFLTFWLAGKMGAPEPFYYPVRLQLNGEFYQLASHNDVVGADQMERFGFDPEGALYKAYGTMVNPIDSTGQPEKKTRVTEGNADYVALAAGIVQTLSVDARRTNVFELLDVPEVLDYLVTARWVHENDDVWANMTIYRDTLGDGLWRIVPFDMNLSWGAIFYEGGAACMPYVEGVQATNDVHKGHPLYGSSQTLACAAGAQRYNRMYETFFQVPELRQMFLRRMRTLLDTWIKPPGTPTNSTELEQLILARRDLIAEEAARDRAKWQWPPKGGQCNFDPGIDLTNGVNQLLNQFIYARRQHFYARHSITNSSLAIGIASGNNAGIPLAQASNIVLRIGQIESNPSSANQGHEFIQVTNPNPVAVDISGWRLDGGVDFTFKPGTVVLPGGSIYVTPDIKAFRTRATTPKTNQALFVVGNYQGSLDARGEIVKLLDDTGRLVHTNGYVGNPSLAQQYLRITEIMYHPGPTNVGSPFTQEDFEYIELKNIGPVTVNLIGVHFTNGITFGFTAGSAITSLAAGQSAVLVKNPPAFGSRYGGSATIAGFYTGTLDNSGERIKLDDAVGEQIMDFSYNNSWYPITDGLGFSLVIVNENAPFDTWDSKESWRASGLLNGSPGTNDPASPTFVPVLVNEVLANSELPQLDAIELWNNSTNPANIGGWWISDDFFAPMKYRVPTNTTIAPGTFMLFTELNFNSGGSDPTNFAFSSNNDEAYIFSADPAGNLTGYYHGFHFGASEPGVTFGRYVASDGDEQFVAQDSQTLGTNNSLPKVGPLVISEIMYHPPDVLTGTNALDDTDNEFIEVHNITGADVPLFDVAFPTNRWQLTGADTDAVIFNFPTNTIPAGGYLVVVSFDPAANSTALASFRNRYGIDTNVAIVGPYSGKLDNSQESVKLRKPDRPDTNIVTHVLVEEIHYHDSAPWNFIADGFGASLHRLVAGDFGNDPTNFTAATPTPGSAFAGGSPPVVTQQPSNAAVFAAGSVGSSTLYLFGTTNFTAVVSGSGQTHYQWSFNGDAIPGATNFTLTLSNIQFGHAGSYNFLAYNSAGSVISSNATLTVLSPVSFTLQPTNQNVLPNTNVTLMAQAVGTGPVRYQWRFEGTNILNATNNSYSFTGASLGLHHGNWSVVAYDDISETVSTNAFIYVLVKPFVTSHIQGVTVLQGGTAVFSLVATGAPIIGYRWLRGGSAVQTGPSPLLVLSNVQFTTTIRVALTNPAQLNANQIFSPSAGTVPLTMLPDADGDGMWDAWETNYFGSSFGTNFALVLPGEDADGDGMSNVDEYRSGTNPTNALSVLKIVLTATNANVLQFVAETNLTYSVQSRTNFTSAAWSNLTNIGLSPSVRTIQVNSASAPPAGERYYRVVTPQAP